MNQASLFCPQCRQKRLFEQPPVNHVLHLLLSLFLCGLWLPVWLLLSIGASFDPFRCKFCGYADKYKYLANPNLRTEEKRNTGMVKEISDFTEYYKIGVIILSAFLLALSIAFALVK